MESNQGMQAAAPPAASLDAAALRGILTGFQEALHAHRGRINDLNVYPVPDGDTGTNMALTLKSVTGELEGAGDGIEAVCEAVSHGALMGARGNSGVIMAQILRGIAGALREAAAAGEPLDAGVLARALSAASEGAYGAVGDPVEGTILTVAREAAEAARDADDGGSDLLGVFSAAHERGYDVLARTPEMLQVLADAGVVDAGGAGLMLLFDAARAELGGYEMPIPDGVVDAGALRVAKTGAASLGPHGEAGGPSIADLRYEVMFLLDADDSDIDGFKEAWAGIGDSIVVVGGDGMWNCHVHTDEIGAAIEAGIAVGRPHRIQVTDLLDQVAEHQDAAPHADCADHASPLADVTEPDKCSVVAVGAGAGVEGIFASLGVSRVVSGGQSMNPSTADLLAAVDSLPTGNVVVLPNNSNIVPVAEQLDSVTERNVSVVPTTSVVEGIASLISFDPGADSDRNCREMAAAAAGVTSGEVARAVRDSTAEIGLISAGDWIGVGPSGIASVAPDEASAATGLLEALITAEHELLTVITGAEADDAAIAAVVGYVEDRYPDLEVETHDGGQPLYPYYLGLE